MGQKGEIQTDRLENQNTSETANILK